MDGKNDVKIKDNRTGEVVKFVADISKAQKLLGYWPSVNLEEGIKSSVEWYMDHLYSFKDSVNHEMTTPVSEPLDSE